MPIRDRLASLKRTLIEDGEVQVMSSLIRAEEEEKTNEFLRRASSLREAIGEMNKALELIRQLHNLLKVSTDNPDRTAPAGLWASLPQFFRLVVTRARLRYLFDELTRVFQQFSSDLDQVVAAVNALHDEVRAWPDKKSAHYRMRKDQTESLRSALHSVILRFRGEEVPFEQETRPMTEKQLREFQMSPTAGFQTQTINETENATASSSDHALSRGKEVGDAEKGSPSPPGGNDQQHPLQCAEVDEQGGDEKLDESVLTEVKQRNDELLLLEEAVSTLNSLHEHLNFLVHAEDPILNRIETNIQQAAEYTVKVMNDTEEAVKLDESAKKKSVIVFCTIGLLLFILILMIITSARVWIIGR
ncbi:hypothetical protein Q1695_015944 [Nippostrongylus brasiliensis]|nr:hypothetical protein Q1695_015944 [Nippostrongylus brasiliensis]